MKMFKKSKLFGEFQNILFAYLVISAHQGLKNGTQINDRRHCFSFLYDF